MPAKTAKLRPPTTVLPTQQDLVGALDDMRRTTHAIIEALPTRLARPAHLATALDISRTLAWRVWKLATPDGDVPAPSSMPGPSGFEVFLKAAAEKGVPNATIDGARRASNRLQDAMRTHAGDKSGSDILLASLTSSLTDESQAIGLRREAFRGTAYLLGVRARAVYSLFIPRLMPDHKCISAVSVSGFYGVQRSRPDMRWLLSWTRTTRDFEKIPGLGYEPLVPAASDEAASLKGRSPLFDEFCSEPLADVRRFARPNRLGGETLEDELFPGPVGLTGASDVVFGQVLRGIPWDAEDRDDMLIRRVETPTELYIVDVALPAELHNGRLPDFKFYMNAHEEVSYLHGDDRDAVPVPERLRHIGHAGGCEPAPEIPRFFELLGRTFQVIGRQPSEFEIYRLEMRFPPVPSTAVIRFARPPAGR